MILAEYHITYAHYGFAIIEALILAKVILIATRCGWGGGLKPLIYSVLYKTICSLFVGAFAVLEHLTEGLLHGKGWPDVRKIMSEGKMNYWPVVC